MNMHLSEVRIALAQEGVRHEMWLSGNDDTGLFVIGVMDTHDAVNSQQIARASALEVDRVHSEFKRHWKNSFNLEIDPAHAPRFPDCRLLFDVMVLDKTP